jgi:large subunit ribosomal protein L25
MQQYKLNVENRENTGRGVARRLRVDGKIPACIYSKGKSRSITVSTVAFRELNREIAGGAALIELTDNEGKEALTLIQDVQLHAIKDTVQHIDFFEVSRGESFVAQVPVHLNGEQDAVGVKNDGGMIDHKSHEVEVRCRPSALPDFIEVDVSKLEVGDAVHISDLPVLEGVEYLGEPDQVVVSCQPPTVVAEPEETDELLEVSAEVPASKVKSDDERASESKED